ncbi:hypothetical protein [Promineifilum sp.]|uniref:hypothetical protein n=1 Tax=Promineifilum sp. TaxID=2664178 RepID=UPI0035B259DF
MLHASANDLIPTPDDVRRIAALDDPVLRNLQITQCYHELARALARHLPGGANWCAVATWASRQAGQSIRREDLRRALERLLRQSADAQAAAQALEAQGAAIAGEGPESLIGAALAVRDALSPAAAFSRTSDAVARGNRKVFEEIGLEFARFLALFAGGPPGESALATFLDGLRPSDPPEGQRYLRQAFTHYHAALSATGKARGELMLLANLEIGLHEQTRLQPEIRAAMDAPIYEPEALRRRLLDELFPDPGAKLRLAAARLAGRAEPLLTTCDRLVDEAQALGRLAVTELLMTLELSGGRLLRLGDDLRAEYPATLRALSNPDLCALLAPFALAPAERRDWSRLPERMRFIADLFRAYHEDESLFAPPFTVGQTATLKAGRRPADL